MKKFLIIFIAAFLPIAASARVCAKQEATLQGIYNAMYPVNAIYISASPTSPADIFGFGTWERFGKGRTLVGLDENDTAFDTVAKTGGAKTHKLSIAEMPNHNHDINPVEDRTGGSGGALNDGEGKATTSTKYTGGNQPHNNLQPYITVYMWRRTS